MPGGGGLLQLHSAGPSDSYLVDNPQITYWKSIFKRIYPFAIETYQQSFLGDVNFGKRSTVQLARAIGDLCSACFLEITLPDLTSFTYDLPDSSTLPRQPRILKTFFTSKTAVIFTVDTTGIYYPSQNGVLGSLLTIKYKSNSTPDKGCVLNLTPIADIVNAGGNGTYNDVAGLVVPDYSAVDRFELRTFSSGSYLASPGGNSPGIRATYADALLQRLAVGIIPANAGWASTADFTLVFKNTTNVSPVTIVTLASTDAYTTAADGTRWYQCDYGASINSGTTFSVDLVVGSNTYVKGIDGVLSNPRTSYNVKWVQSIGFALLKNIELEIGGARIDYYDRIWQDVWSELFVPLDKKPGLYNMIYKYTNKATGVDNYDIWDWERSTSGGISIFVPLLFFCRNPGQAINLAALTFHDVHFNIEWSTFAECIKCNSTIPVANPSPLPQLNANFLSDIVYASETERTLFATKNQDYLITTMQSNLGTPIIASLSAGQARKIDLAFTNPVKELIWVFVSDTNGAVNPVTGNNHFNYNPTSSPTDELFTSAKVLLNGNDRAAARGPTYFRLLQPFQYHSYASQKFLFLFSFALHPEHESQPSGHLNADRFNSIQLHLTLSSNIPDGTLYVFAPTWNMLRYVKGYAGLAFTRTG